MLYCVVVAARSLLTLSRSGSVLSSAITTFVAAATSAGFAPLTTTLIELLPVMLSWATWICQPAAWRDGQVVGELLLLGVEVGAAVQPDDDRRARSRPRR